MSIRDIVRRAGGAKAISERSQGTARPVAVKTVYSWLRNGIPDWHWDLVCELSGAGLEEVHAANRLLESDRASPDQTRVSAVA